MATDSSADEALKKTRELVNGLQELRRLHEGARKKADDEVGAHTVTKEQYAKIVDELKTENQALRTSQEALQKQLAELAKDREDRLSEVNVKLDALQAERDALYKTTLEQKQAFEGALQAQDELRKVREANTKQAEEIARLTEDLALTRAQEFEAQVQQRDEQIVALQQQNEGLTQSDNRAKEEVAILTASLEEREAMLVALQKALNAEIGAHNENRQLLRQNDEEREQALEQERAQAMELERTLSEVRGELESARASNEALHGEMAGMAREREERLAELQMKNDQSREEIARLKEEMAQSKEAQLFAQLQERDAQVQNLSLSDSMAREENAKLSKALQERDAQLASLRDELVNWVRDESAKQAQDINRAIKEATGTLQVENISLKNGRQELENQLATARQQLANTQTELARLAAEEQNVQVAKERVQQELQVYQDRTSDIHNEFAKVQELLQQLGAHQDQ